MEDLINLNEAQTMSSREIAELTGKRHDNVLRDVDVLNENYEKFIQSRSIRDHCSNDDRWRAPDGYCCA